MHYDIWPPKHLIACIGSKYLFTFVCLYHSLSHVKGNVGCSVEDNVNDGFESVGRQALGWRYEVAGGVVDHNVWQFTGTPPNLICFCFSAVSQLEGVLEYQSDTFDSVLVVLEVAGERYDMCWANK